MKDFLDKFFDLFREYQEEIPPHKMAKILRDYVDRFRWLKKLKEKPRLQK